MKIGKSKSTPSWVNFANKLLNLDITDFYDRIDTTPKIQNKGLVLWTSISNHVYFKITKNYL